MLERCSGLIYLKVRSLVCVGNNGFKVLYNLSLIQDWPVLAVQNVKVIYSRTNIFKSCQGQATTGMHRVCGQCVRCPNSLTELTATQDDDMPRIMVDSHFATTVGRDTRSSEQLGVLVHVEGLTADGIWFEEPVAEIMNEAE